MIVKTRFAPSPTGKPHIWHLRTAIYAWLTAKKSDWIFFMRLEDTDQDRFVNWTADILIKTIKWLWIEIDEWFLWEWIPEKWDFWPYVQSKRKDLYKKYAEELMAKWAAYYCFCPKVDREEDLNPKLFDIHDTVCRNLSQNEIDSKISNWESYVIRHKVPLWITVITEDIIHWTQKIETNTIDDSVLLKSDWHATYHLAHLVDDHLMWTTHVTRTEEWLPSLPKHFLLFSQMWWECPKYAHASMIMIIDKETWNKRKFAKRKWDPDALSLIKAWYLSEAVFNYVVFLWWNPWSWETREIYSKEELIKIFDLKNCHKAWALFDIEKLNWMNSRYIIAMDIDELYVKLEQYLKEYESDFYLNTFEKFPKEFSLKIIKELQTKIKKFDEYKSQASYLYNDANVRLDLLTNGKMWIDSLDFAKKSLELAQEILSSKDNFSSEELRNIFIEKIRQNWLKNGQVLWPVRVAISWEEFSIWAFELIEILWVEKSRQRIAKILEEIWKI